MQHGPKLRKGQALEWGKEQDMEQGAEAGEGYGTVKRTEP